MLLIMQENETHYKSMFMKFETSHKQAHQEYVAFKASSDERLVRYVFAYLC